MNHEPLSNVRNDVPAYSTLEEIRMRKDQLSDAIEQDNEVIASLWDNLFSRNEDATKGEYIASVISNTVTAIDAFLLVRKLMNSYSNIFHIFSRSDKNKKKKRR